MNRKCRFCHSTLSLSLIDLGATPLANSNLSGEADKASEKHFPLHVVVCETCFLAQTTENVPAADIFHDEYAYFSSFSSSWTEHARQYAAEMTERFNLNSESLILEAASNDGYLLQHFVSQKIPVLGVEPAGNCAKVAEEKGIRTVVDFFNTGTAKRLVEKFGEADLTAANNVLAHVPDISDFIGGFKVALKPEGVATFEFPHLLNLIEKVQFDTIYHEHYSYLSMVAVERILSKHELRAFDVQLLKTHGGSLRVFVCHEQANYREEAGLLNVRAAEEKAKLADVSGYSGFPVRVAKIREDFLSFLSKAKAEGKSIAGYGAAAKGNTFLNFCGANVTDINFVADRNTHKQGRLLPGVHAPIVDPSQIDILKPDYLLILPWNLADEISQQHSEIRNWGGQFVTAIPELRIF